MKPFQRLLCFYYNFVTVVQAKITMRRENICFLGEQENDLLMPNGCCDVLSVLSEQQIVLWKYDIASKRYLFPDNYFHILGLDKEGISFTSIEEAYRFFHPDDLENYKTAFNELLDSGIGRRTISYRYLGKDGHTLWFEDHLCIYEDSSDSGLGLKAYTMNVTSEREKEKEIKHLAAYSNRIIEALPDFIFIIDRAFHFVDVLVSEHSVLLHPIEYIKGSDGHNMFSPGVCELYVETIRKCLLDGKKREIEYFLDVNGQRYYFQARVAPFGDDTVLALIRDIGSRVRHAKELIEAKRRAEESDKMKSFFLANMSHEIRTPLNAIVGFSELISMTENEVERNEYLGVIRQNSDLLVELVNDILDLSRIESGKTLMNFEEVNLTDLILDVGRTHQFKVPPSIHFSVVKPDANVIVTTDRNRLVQVLSNLLSNAIKNTVTGYISLGMRIVADCVELFVSDTGSGIPKDKLSLIFNRFEKLNDSIQGTGLGLYICKSLVDRLGGKIEVSSELGKGSTFSVFLHQQAPVTASSKREKKIILAVEDSPEDFHLLDEYLNHEYSVLWGNDEETVLHKFMCDHPDLVLINMKLEKASSVNIIERIRKISASVPVIAVTEHIHYTDQQQAFQAGYNEVVSKPYSFSRLKETIDSFLKDG